jgi:cytidyltransferase-like protein
MTTVGSREASFSVESSELNRSELAAVAIADFQQFEQFHRLIPLMRIGLFGGSFDPVHRGHLLLAECCWRQARLDLVEFVPTAQQPLKPRGPIASEADRVAMLRLAIAERPEFALSLIEIERGGVSYTVDAAGSAPGRRGGAEFRRAGADRVGGKARRYSRPRSRDAGDAD